MDRIGNLVKMRGRRIEGGGVIWEWVGDLLFVCEKITDMILIKMKSIYANVNSVILTYAIITKGGE